VDRITVWQRMLTVAGADHHDVAVTGGRPYLQAIEAFLREMAGT